MKKIRILLIIAFTLFLSPLLFAPKAFAVTSVPRDCDYCTAADCGLNNYCTACQICNRATDGKINNPLLPPSLTNLSGNSYLQQILNIALILAFTAGSVIFIFMLLSGAITWIFSGGDKTATENARKRIQNALVGIVILLAVFAIINTVGAIFGINLTTIQIPTF